LHVDPEQHGSPGSPHCVQLVPLQTKVELLQASPEQQGWPSAPHPVLHVDVPSQ
jgi:hypothetical protein